MWVFTAFAYHPQLSMLRHDTAMKSDQSLKISGDLRMPRPRGTAEEEAEEAWMIASIRAALRVPSREESVGGAAIMAWSELQDSRYSTPLRQWQRGPSPGMG
jgi:hypothetical protein